MPRRILYLMLFLALVLAACKPAAKQTETVTAGAGKTPVATGNTTAVPQQAATLSLPSEPQVAGCTVVSFLPTPDPTSLFPPITADDWTRGPLTATVKIIEYSDFQ